MTACCSVPGFSFAQYGSWRGATRSSDAAGAVRPSAAFQVIHVPAERAIDEDGPACAP